ncbi:DoxX family protein [Candidatus Mycobacterium wuenschmannii]|uniref:DoxX family protein n=1 Tax=Candidatus Mycobacterium wuenschmannii TaxID=3027808 RepID=A0ABY8VUI2_9MYCO|nr:DoxX family protein [Candidatus Mycobacterium wuenschmannii]WIM85808.1 DoxX family protein [Candidatus Mycobacterium wuenschmannii]
MNLALWICQGVLALAFAGAGLMKLSFDGKTLAEKGMGFASEVSPAFLKSLGAAEVAGAIGVVVPGLVHIAPVLVPVAAACLALVMVGAIVVHVQRKEWSGLVAPAVLLAVAVFVAVQRFGPYAF